MKTYCIASLIEVKEKCPIEEALAQGKTTKQSAQIVVKNAMYPSNQLKEDQCIVEIVTRSIEAGKVQYLQ